jgi:uncharacterized membrane protein YwaF
MKALLITLLIIIAWAVMCYYIGKFLGFNDLSDD